jgi:hypothetical protein
MPRQMHNRRGIFSFHLLRFTLFLDDHFGYIKNSSTTPERLQEAHCTLNVKNLGGHRSSICFCSNCLAHLYTCRLT